MAHTLEVIRFRDLLEVTAVPGFVPGLDPPTLIVRGADLSSAEVILLNEMPSPEFMIVNKTTVYAQVPAGMERLATVEVLSSDFTRTETASKVQYEIGDTTRRTEGILKLVQLFMKWVLQSPGSDIFTPSRGGGLQQVVGQISTTRDMKPIFATITRAIGNTVSQIRSAQMAVPNLPVDERLLSAQLVNIDVYEAQMQARARVIIRSLGGAEAVSGLVL